ncbi:MAG: AEC family transporter [Candidatus Omnitrophica bacterium]|nr:AEC family transporter [Candidatus Omnitrophota bacterium]
MFYIAATILKLSIIALFGFILYKKGLINDGILKFLTGFVVNFTVPFLIFSNLIENHEVVLGYSLWKFLFISIAIFSSGLLLAIITSGRHKHKFKREFLSLVSFQNAGYLPMNLAVFLFSGVLRQAFLVYVFLHLLGFNIIMWSVGSFFIFKEKEESFNLKSLFTAPIISTAIGLLFVYTKAAAVIPAIILDPVRMIGDVSFVLSMIVLGSWLAKVELQGSRSKTALIAKVAVNKLVVLPLIFFLILIIINQRSLLGVFVVLQTAMPSAASLPIIASMRRADNDFISQGVFFTHICSIITIPVWLLILRFAGFYF